MSQHGVIIAASVATFAGLVLLVAYHVDLWRRAAFLRKEASRFPMFAVRDRLVRLVVDGAIAESEPAWHRTYAAVTGLLSMHETLHLDDVIRRYLAFLIGTVISPATRSRAQKISGEMQRATKRSRPFRDTVVEMEQAFKRMVMMRTDPWHKLRLRVFLWRMTLPRPFCPTLVVNVVSQVPAGSRARLGAPQRARAASHVRSSLRRPKYGELAAFGSSNVACM